MNALKEKIDSILGLKGTLTEIIGRPNQATIEYQLPNGVRLLGLGIYERGDGRWYIGSIDAPISAFLFRVLGDWQ